MPLTELPSRFVFPLSKVVLLNRKVAQGISLLKIPVPVIYWMKFRLCGMVDKALQHLASHIPVAELQPCQIASLYTFKISVSFHLLFLLIRRSFSSEFTWLNSMHILSLLKCHLLCEPLLTALGSYAFTLWFPFACSELDYAIRHITVIICLYDASQNILWVP